MQELDSQNLTGPIQNVERSSCPDCGRPTAASRPQCLYCGALLGLVVESQGAQPVPKHSGPSLSEAGYTLFAAGPCGDIESAAAILAIDPAIVPELLASRGMPLGRTTSAADAATLAASLEHAGCLCNIVGDTELNLYQSNTRIFSVDLANPGLSFIDFNTREQKTIVGADVVLIVEGWLVTTRTDAFSKGMRPASAKRVYESVTADDGPVIDIYVESAKIGYRILPAGFDFSFLGPRMRLTASENWSLLIETLIERFPHARIDRNYRRLRRSLEVVWPADNSAAFSGKVNSGFGRRDFSSVMSTSNLAQFNMYSRTRQYFL